MPLDSAYRPYKDTISLNGYFPDRTIIMSRLRPEKGGYNRSKSLNSNHIWIDQSIILPCFFSSGER